MCVNTLLILEYVNMDTDMYVRPIVEGLDGQTIPLDAFGRKAPVQKATMSIRRRTDRLSFRGRWVSIYRS